VNRWLSVLILLFTSCDVDPDDCQQYGTCEAYRPAGLLCGLVNGPDRHWGGSCAFGWDPAAHSINRGALGSAFPDNPDPCPAGHAPAQFRDEEANGAWHTCAALGNEIVSSTSLRDVRAGAVCGMASLHTGESVLCMDKDPGLGECPDGMTLRVIADSWWAQIDEDTQAPICMLGSIACSGIDGTAQLGGHAIAFCEVRADAGCTGDCPALGGELCGLHVRRLDGVHLVPQSTPHLPNAGAYASVPAGLEFERNRLLLRADSGLYPRLAIPAIRRAIEVMGTEHGQCLGEPIPDHAELSDTDDPPPPCPGDLDLVCTSDYGNGGGSLPGAAPWDRAIHRAALCWCDEPTSQQLWEPAIPSLRTTTRLRGNDIEIDVFVDGAGALQPDQGLRAVALRAEWPTGALSATVESQRTDVGLSWFRVYDGTLGTEEVPVSMLATTLTDPDGSARLGLSTEPVATLVFGRMDGLTDETILMLMLNTVVVTDGSLPTAGDSVDLTFEDL
jgi:hypothetical protein